jgi:hypothetical protein
LVGCVAAYVGYGAGCVAGFTGYPSGCIVGCTAGNGGDAAGCVAGGWAGYVAGCGGVLGWAGYEAGHVARSGLGVTWLGKLQSTAGRAAGRSTVRNAAGTYVAGYVAGLGLGMWRGSWQAWLGRVGNEVGPGTWLGTHGWVRGRVCCWTRGLEIVFEVEVVVRRSISVLPEICARLHGAFQVGEVAARASDAEGHWEFQGLAGVVAAGLR